MFALRTAEHLDLIKGILPHIIQVFDSSASDAFAFQVVAEACRNAVVVTFFVAFVKVRYFCNGLMTRLSRSN